MGLADTASDFNPCHGNAPALSEAVKRGIAACPAPADSVPDDRHPRTFAQQPRGYARLFHDCVPQADEGCDFDFLVDGRRAPDGADR